MSKSLPQQNDWDDAMHILCPVCTVMTLCNKPPEGRDRVPGRREPRCDAAPASDKRLGRMNTPALAEEVVQAHNAVLMNVQRKAASS